MARVRFLMEIVYAISTSSIELVLQKGSEYFLSYIHHPSTRVTSRSRFGSGARP
ncbi:hypothetical protein TRAPUB_11255 [Trametes pubescens]|uniref:Uncharacterized protein n=1 Tax=Trametes pubescens TaxID=154538 RepID=A0A1M2VX61_TRAPU|nr:hypothetical protein TRAPUB_11255 [Trametes pubescens]